MSPFGRRTCWKGDKKTHLITHTNFLGGISFLGKNTCKKNTVSRRRSNHKVSFLFCSHKWENTDPLMLSRHHLRTLVTTFFLFHFAVHLLAPKKAQRILGRLIRLLGKILVPFLEAGQLYYQPKQCTITREIPQRSIRFSINFDFPKKWVAWKNIMTSPRPIQKTHPISTHPKNAFRRPPQKEEHLLQCFLAFRLPWGGWKLVTSDRAIFTLLSWSPEEKTYFQIGCFSPRFGPG